MADKVGIPEGGKVNTNFVARLFESIEEGLLEALAIARGEIKPANFFIPPDAELRKPRWKG